MNTQLSLWLAGLVALASAVGGLVIGICSRHREVQKLWELLAQYGEAAVEMHDKIQELEAK